MEAKNKPPMGIIPRKIHRQLRIEDLKGAINRYTLQTKLIPFEWVEEYNELIEEIDLINKRGKVDEQ